MRFALAFVALTAMLTACGREDQSTSTSSAPVQAPAPVADSRPMGGAKSVMTFFVTSRGSGEGGDLGGLAGADAHCQMLAEAEKAGDHTWRAYLSATATAGGSAVNARDRIGRGPWYNGEGILVAAGLDELHGGAGRLNRETAVTERIDPVKGSDDDPNMHDILTGSRPDGTAFTGNDDVTCANWTSSAGGRAQVGHHDRSGRGAEASSWNSAHPSQGCSQSDLQSTGGAGLFYCFAID